MENYKYDVFISHSRKDQKIVEAICHYLESHRIRCFVSYRDIPRASDWAETIVDGLHNSRMMLVVFSENFNNSRQVNNELHIASNDNKPIFTFRLSDAKFEGTKEYFLQNLNWLDAFPEPSKEFGTLLKHVCKLLDIKLDDATVGDKSEQTGEDIAGQSNDSNRNSYSDGRSSNDNSSWRNLLKTIKPIHWFVGVVCLLCCFMLYNNIESSSNNLVIDGTISGHAWVDLGLPSGLKWATCNVGASSPEEPGGYYAWGETEEKNDYDLDTYKWCKGSYDTMTKYCTNSDYGTVDNRTTLDPSDDVARVKWGGSWRMPTKEEFDELIDNCTWEWTTQGGKSGYKVTSKKNGNSIFLPAAGLCEREKLLLYSFDGYYWSATVGGDSGGACYLFFESGRHCTFTNARKIGFTVRPVSVSE